MVEAEKVLLDRFYQEYWIFAILSLMTLIILIFLTVLYLVKFKTFKLTEKIIIPAVIVLLVIISIALVTYFSRYCADYAYLKSNSPIKNEGRVIEFTHAVGDGDLTVTYSRPLILMEGTNDQVILNVIKAEAKLNIGQTYTFVYLPNTGIAEVVNPNVIN